MRPADPIFIDLLDPAGKQLLSLINCYSGKVRNRLASIASGDSIGLRSQVSEQRLNELVKGWNRHEGRRAYSMP